MHMISRASLVSHALLIAVLCMALYAPALHSPFMLDEDALISENPIVKDLGYFAHPTSARGLPEYNLFITRYISTLTLAIDYRLHGLDTRGYHAFNLALHIANALLVLALARLLMARLGFDGESISWAAALAGALYTVHPLQSEAVIYIMARPALVCALFYLSSIVLYVFARRETATAQLPYALSLISALLAMMSKQNAATLPLALALVEWVFLKGLLRASVVRLLPYFILLLIYPPLMAEGGVGFGTVFLGSPGSAKSLSVFDGDYIKPNISRAEYLLTQTRSVALYLKLMLLPIGQNLLHYVLPSKSVTEPAVMASLALHVALGGASVVGVTRRQALPRALGFGVMWLYVTLLVESSILPIPRLAAEYRMYLPMAGLCTGMGIALPLIWQRLGLDGKKAFLAATLIVMLALCIATYMRSTVWSSKVSLWQDAADKSPYHFGAQQGLGIALWEAGRHEEAARRYYDAYMLNPGYPLAADALASYYIEQNQAGKAERLLLDALGRYPNEATLNLSLGVLYAGRGQHDLARKYLERAVALAPNNPMAHYNLGLVYYNLGLWDISIPMLNEALRLDPGLQAAGQYLMVIGQKRNH